MSPESAARPPYLEVLARIIKEVVDALYDFIGKSVCGLPLF